MGRLIQASKNWYAQQLEAGTFNIRYLILWFMVAIFPLLVIPHPFAISFAFGVAPPNYFYLPRYAILGVVALIALVIMLRDRTRIGHPAFIPLGCFIIFSMVSALLAPIPMTAWIGSPFRFTGLTTYYFCIILFILAQTNDKTGATDKTGRLLSALVYTAGLVSLLGLLQYFGINLVPHEPYRMAVAAQPIAYGTMPHPNFFGTYTAFILPAAIFLYLRTPKTANLLWPAVIYAGLLVSECRGTWIAALIGLLLILWYAWKRPDLKKSYLLVLAVLLLVTAILMPTYHGILLARLLSIGGNYGINLYDTAGSYRMYIWRGAFHLFLLYWPFGIGPDHLIYARLVTPANEIADKAHNIYLEMGLTMGLFTLLSWLVFLSFFFRRWKTEIGFTLLTMISVYLIQGFTNIDVVPVMPLFWIVLGLALAEQAPVPAPAASAQAASAQAASAAG